MKDIFISYAHLDNQPMTPGQKGWVEKFHAALEAREQGAAPYASS